MNEEKNVGTKPLTRQEENWKLMTVLQIPWHHCERIEAEEDRCFLVEKANEVEGYLKQQQLAQQEMMDKQQQQQQQPPQSNIITPFQ
ncbi:hypothetical protein CL634_10565 [bacterium]|nr:hypothetical protein [bacterium]